MVCLIPFLVISVLGVAFILGAMATSSFLEKKKQAATLLALGAKKGKFFALYIGESMLISVIGALLALFLSPLLSRLANLYFSSTLAVGELIQIPYRSLLGIPFLMELALVAIAMILVLLAAGIPLKRLLKGNLGMELRDE